MRFWRRLITHAATSLMSSPLRSSLALLGIVIGAAAVIAMINIGYNAKQAMLRQLDGMGAQATMIDYEDGAQIGVVSLVEIKDRLYEKNPQLEAIAVTAVSGGTLTREGATVEASVLGATDDFYAMLGVTLMEGRFTAEADHGEAYAVMGWQLMERFRKQGTYLGVGDTVVFNGAPVTLVGVLDYNRPSMLSPTEINDSLFVPLNSFRRLNLDTTRWRMLALRSQDADYLEIQHRLRASVKRFLPYTDVRVTSPEQLIQSIEQQNQILTLTLGAIGGISLLVGGIGVMNIMLVSVSERRKEIGLRMAIGARIADIKRQFLAEALILCLVGGCAGLATGVAIAFGFTRLSGELFELSTLSVVLGLGVSTLVGVCFGYYPAAAAAKLDPVDTLYGD